MVGTTELVNRLIEIQNRGDFTDTQMAQLIGCSRQLYQMTRTSKAPVGVKILKGALRAFPEIRGDAYIFLTGSADKETVKADACTTHHQPHQDGKWAVFRGWLRVRYLGLKKILRRNKANSDMKSKKPRSSVIKI